MKQEIRLEFLILVLYTIVILLADYLIYFLNLNYIVALIISTIVVIALFVLIKNKIKIINSFEKQDIIFFVFLFFIMGITIVFPDKMFDSLNYHLLNQQIPFKDNTSLFFPSSLINSTTFPLGDRLFFPFRIILGYRLGVIFNYYLLIVLYYQVKKILKCLLNKNTLVINALAILIVLQAGLIDIIDSYYVDLVSLVMMLELFIIIFVDEKLSLKKNTNTFKLIIIGFLSGLSFCLKLSNAFFIVIFAIAYIIKHINIFKYINIKQIVFMLLFFLLPIFVYMFSIYNLTGNPVFPYYNKIFQSDIIPNFNWFDVRYGPQNLVEVVTWPIKMHTCMLRANDVYLIEPMWALGYISSFIIVILGLIKKNKKEIFLGIVSILSFICWSKFSLGYVRYGLIAFILGSITFYYLLMKIFDNKKYILLSVMLIFGIYNVSYSVNQITNGASFITLHNIFDEGMDSYIYNLKHLFDREKVTINLPKDSVYGPMEFDSGYAIMNYDIPIINMYVHKDELITDNYNQIFTNKLKNYNYIISDCLSFRLDEFINNSNYYKYSITNYIKTIKPSYLSKNDVIYVFEIAKDENANNSVSKYYYHQFDVKKGNNVSGYIGLASEFLGKKDRFIEIRNSSDELIDIIKLDSKNGNLSQIKFNSLKNDQIKLYIKDDNGNIVNDEAFIVFNLSVK